MPTATADLVKLFVESDALRLAELVRQKEVTPAELTETAISLIESTGPEAERGRHPGFRTREGARGGELPRTVLSAAFPISSRISGPAAKGCR